MHSRKIDSRVYEDRREVASFLWEKTTCGILSFVVSFDVIEAIGPIIPWSKVTACAFIAHKMHDTEPCQKISEYAEDTGERVDPADELMILKELGYSVPRNTFLDELFELSDAMGLARESVELPARLAVVHRFHKDDEKACIAAVIGVACRIEGSLSLMNSIDKLSSPETAIFFFAALLNARNNGE